MILSKMKLLYIERKLVPNSTGDVMEWIMYDHFPGLVYLSNHDMSQIITDNFTTNLDRVVP